jgi:hypothetical protein
MRSPFAPLILIQARPVPARRAVQAAQVVRLGNPRLV